jgi:hypothetical protein
MKRYLALLLSALVISCGGGGDGGGGAGSSSSAGGGGTPPPGGGTPPPGGGTPPPGGGTPPPGGGTPPPEETSDPRTPAVAGARIEETNVAVTLDSTWTSADPRFGWSGGAAVQSDVVGATASFIFTGTSVRWLGARGRGMGVARVRIDGGPGYRVDLEVAPNDVIRTPAITISDLTDGPHTLTIEVLVGRVVLDAFDVQPTTTVSHWQDTDPNARFSAGWTKSAIGPCSACPESLPWSGSGFGNPPELPVTAQETSTANETVTLPFRGTAISWIGYRCPDCGIALVQVDGGAPIEVDTYYPTAKFQSQVFRATGLADANHTLTITATGRKNAASSAARIVVDAFDVMTPGRRYEEYDASITKSVAPPDTPPEGPFHWNRNLSRVWSEGYAATSNQTGATLTFSFTGTSVSWIGCQKSSAGGRANVYIDGVFEREVRLAQKYPIEGYQMTVFRKDGLADGPHTLTIVVTSSNNGPYVVVDAFDVRP